MDQYFVILQSGEETVYPEVRYVFSDDAFHPEADAAEQNSGDISVLVDLDETGQTITSCQSISPDWQATNVSMTSQALGNSAVPRVSQLIRVEGIHARQNTDITPLGGSPQSQAAAGLELIEQLEKRHAEVRRALHSHSTKSN